MKKGMTPGAFYSQILLSKHDGYQIINSIRDKDGQDYDGGKSCGE